MSLKAVLPALLIAALPFAPAWADDATPSPTSMHAIAPVLANPDNAEKFLGVKFYFGDQPHPPVATDFGEVRSIRRVPTLFEVDAACQRAMTNALIMLAKNARKQGADAVVDIRSGFGDRIESNSTQYVCANGFNLTGLTLFGHVVKLQ